MLETKKYTMAVKFVLMGLLGLSVVLAVNGDAGLATSFERADIDGDLTVSESEFREWMQSYGNLLDPVEQIEVFDKYDTDNNGFQVREYVTMFNETIANIGSSVEIVTQFAHVDRNDDGYIRRREINAYGHFVGLDLTDADLDGMFAAADLYPKDGKICLCEYTSFKLGIPLE